MENDVVDEARKATELALAANVAGVETLAGAVITLAGVVESLRREITELRESLCAAQTGHIWEPTEGVNAICRVCGAMK